VLSRPLYEGLPWGYLLCGLLALLGSYFETSTGLSLLLGIPGLLAVLGGTVVLLRRLRAQYDAPEALDQATVGPLPAAPDEPIRR